MSRRRRRLKCWTLRDQVAAAQKGLLRLAATVATETGDGDQLAALELQAAASRAYRALCHLVAMEIFGTRAGHGGRNPA